MKKLTWLSRFIIPIVALAMTLPALAEEKKPPPKDMAAIVNGEAISMGEFDGEVLKIQKTLLGFGRPLTCSQLSTVRKEVLEGMVRREILYQESVKSGIKPDKAAVEKEFNTVKEQFANETEFKNELGRRNISEEVLKSRLEKNSALQQYVDRLAAKITVSDNDMLTYYGGHLDLFKQPLQASVSHILVQTDSKWEGPRKQDARRKAEQIMKDLKKGKDFAALAREFSDGPTRTSGGELGYVKMGQLEKQLETVVFSLKPGETSEIIETNYGLHIFKATDRKPETILAYEEVKEKIRQFLREQKAKEEADLKARTLREKAGVESFPEENVSSR